MQELIKGYSIPVANRLSRPGIKLSSAYRAGFVCSFALEHVSVR